MIRVILLSLALTAGVQAQNPTAPKPDPKAVPRTPEGKPDFSGLWENPKSTTGVRGNSLATVFDKRNFAPLKPGGEPFFEPRTGEPRHDEPRDFCMPAGWPSGMLAGYPVHFNQNKDYLFMVHEFQRMSRVIPLDARKHREGLDPSYYGDPIGHWEGDTLVIETTQLKRWSLDDYFYTNGREYRMHSDALRTIERITYKNPTTLSYNMTIDDPKIFTRPWLEEFEMKLRKDWEPMGLIEYVCEENNRCPGGKCVSDPK